MNSRLTLPIGASLAVAFAFVAVAQAGGQQATITPLERPRGAGEKELLSAAEVEEANTQSDTREIGRASCRERV